MKRLVTVILLSLLLLIVLYLYSPSCKVFKETLPHCYPKTIEEKPIYIPVCHKSEIDLHQSRLTSPKERRPAGSSANASLGCTSFSAHKERRDSTNACDTFVSRVLDCTVKTPLYVGIRNTPVEDVRQVKLQHTLSQGYKRQQAGVEDEQKYQPSAHGEAVWHGAVLQGNTRQRACFQMAKTSKNQEKFSLD